MVPGLLSLHGFLDEDEQRRLAAAIDAEPWSTLLRRRVQHYGHRYDYGGRGVRGVRAAAAAVGRRVSVTFRTVERPLNSAREPAP
ncbi:hypothetical protein [Actinomadura sp. WAC 06369]|uniref:hypothetical protein n=1 Tax=Actinomadura sp. WAC 06369 TaxID=2203193 RepID=UPI000F79AB50|nr:hypothetical protein [Actinomadura sp. WAC 06369]RSN62298.1 hypothetical protein DMH08_19515 [Actinomadura sp. WAC 06369]